MGHTDNMQDYRMFVSERATAEDGKVVLNRTPEHAAVVLAAVFSKADEIVEIISDNLPNLVWGNQEVLSAVLAFLRKGDKTKLRIVVEERFVLLDNELIQAIIKEGLERHVKLFLADAEAVNDYKCHFAVADGRHFRFQGDRADFGAMVQFGMGGIGESLRKFFASIRQRSQEIAIS